MHYKIQKNNNIHILYDPELAGETPELLFSARRDKALERGIARFFEHRGVPMVLKRYHRGGLIGKLIKKTYPVRSRERSRMWREFRLLATLRKLALPVPEPVAARYRRRSPLTCQGELVTRRINNARTLLDTVRQQALGSSVWRQIGATIANFHRHNVYHADLNATNILIDNREQVYLIDFDKGRIRQAASSGWRIHNLRRLRRSLDKLKGLYPDMHFSDTNWQALLDGYDQG